VVFGVPKMLVAEPLPKFGDWITLTSPNRPRVGAIALQPCSLSLNNCDSLNHLSKTVLVGTGEPNSAIDSYYGLGFCVPSIGGK